MISLRSWLAVAVLSALAASLAAGCSGEVGGEAEPECLDEPGPLDCEPLYGLHGDLIAPTFDEVFARTLSDKCADTGCHSGPEARAGMAFDDVDGAYAALMQPSTAGYPRVEAGDTRCGRVIVRLETPGKSYSMPAGNPLLPTELCSIRHWIANGANR